MNLVLVSDIFGKIVALKALAEELNAQSIVEPYGGVDMAFYNEQQAYEYFSQHISLDEYVAILQKAIKPLAGNIILIDFSVGASAIWSMSAHPAIKTIAKGICFYSSQIRHHTELNPAFEIELIFPHYEQHFDVKALQAKLATKPNVSAKCVDYLHGFMNSHSNNFNQRAYDETLTVLSNKLI